MFNIHFYLIFLFLLYEGHIKMLSSFILTFYYLCIVSDLNSKNLKLIHCYNKLLHNSQKVN